MVLQPPQFGYVYSYNLVHQYGKSSQIFLIIGKWYSNHNSLVIITDCVHHYGKELTNIPNHWQMVFQPPQFGYVYNLVHQHWKSSQIFLIIGKWYSNHHTLVITFITLCTRMERAHKYSWSLANVIPTTRVWLLYCITLCTSMERAHKYTWSLANGIPTTTLWLLLMTLFTSMRRAHKYSWSLANGITTTTIWLSYNLVHQYEKCSQIFLILGKWYSNHRNLVII